MEFGYSSSASNSPDPQAFSIPLIYDTTTDSSCATSPEELQQMMQYNPMPAYEQAPYTSTDMPLFYQMPASPTEVFVEPTTEEALEMHDRRRKKSSSVSSKSKNEVTNMHLRRRAQNRASQRAFRERKEKHLKELEEQLAELNDKHQDLLDSYTKQAEEVSRLNAKVSLLTDELDSARSAASEPSSFDDALLQTPDIPQVSQDYYFSNRNLFDMPPKALGNDGNGLL